MIVVKIGGRVLKNNIQAIAEDIVELWHRGEDIVLVHGGGDMVSEYSIRLGVEPKFILSPEGIRSRFTSREELDVYLMVMAGKINKEIVAKIIGLGGKAVGLSGVDGGILIAERKKRILALDERGRKRVVEGGYTGRVIEVNTIIIKTLLNMRYIVVVAPIAVDNDGTPLNIDGDQAALKLAIALGAERIVLLTDVNGIIIDGNIVREIKASNIDSILSIVGPGINRKLLQAKEAIGSSVREVIIANGLRDRPITRALNEPGTVIRL
ncbi:MAG: [LysW]-aminoadipate/[LysW]-glutamate kinase [Acidilobaceae archaeon]